MRYLVTGGAGFIGSNFIRYLFNRYGKDAQVLNLDALTYAGIRKNLDEYEGKKNYKFMRGDIRNPKAVAKAFQFFGKRGPDVVVNFAAETHVDRSIDDVKNFIETDVLGVHVLLDAARNHAPRLRRFIQISTDEVYGSIPGRKSSKEDDPLKPRNPYSAAKAGGDRMAYAYSQTHEMPVIVTRASNNYGPYQYPEKLIPLFVTNAIENIKLPLYGAGKNVRDWLYVDDHCSAIDFLIEHGKNSEIYNIGGGNELRNVEITHKILGLLNKPTSLIKYVEDRIGHDFRYSLSTAKLQDLGWKPETDFETGLEKTVKWYVDNQRWWRRIKTKSAAYKTFMQQHYKNR